MNVTKLLLHVPEGLKCNKNFKKHQRNVPVTLCFSSVLTMTQKTRVSPHDPLGILLNRVTDEDDFSNP